MIAAAFRAACAEELAALKPGNVHVHADGHGMRVSDFLRSAEAAAPALCRTGARLGARILGAVEATRKVVGQNTNLGIVLLCAPLAMAAEGTPRDLRPALRRVLARADLEDAEATFRAIAGAAPGGLGTAPRYDVRAPATVPLAVAMNEAAGRDRIAWQWAHGFADVFGRGISAHQAARARWRDPVAATLAVYLEFLSAFPDSHVLRRHGAVIAERTRLEAVAAFQRLQDCEIPAALLPDLLRWDAALKRQGINPGTSADLTVATLFTQKLQSMLRSEAVAC